MSFYIKNYVQFLILLCTFVGESDGEDVYWNGTGVAETSSTPILVAANWHNTHAI
jgi:hypothetical protein